MLNIGEERLKSIVKGVGEKKILSAIGKEQIIDALGKREVISLLDEEDLISAVGDNEKLLRKLLARLKPEQLRQIMEGNGQN